MIPIACIVLSAFLMNQSAVPPDSVVRGDTLKLLETPASLSKLVEQVKKQAVKTEDVEMELDGLLVDLTKTKGERIFMICFTARGKLPPVPGILP